MRGFADLERDAPEFAAAARRLLGGGDGLPIGFLATASVGGTPHLAPVCPIVCDDHLYLSSKGASPKTRDLRENGRFALHAFLGANDEELQLRGRGREVDEAGERARVHEAIPFAAFDREDPIFRLELASVLWVFWERVGQPDTRAVRRRFSW